MTPLYDAFAFMGMKKASFIKFIAQGFCIKLQFRSTNNRTMQ